MPSQIPNVDQNSSQNLLKGFSDFISNPREATHGFFFKPITVEQAKDRLMWRVAPGIAFSLLGIAAAAAPAMLSLYIISAAAMLVGGYKDDKKLLLGGAASLIILLVLPAVISLVTVLAQALMALTLLELLTRTAYTGYRAIVSMDDSAATNK